MKKGNGSHTRSIVAPFDRPEHHRTHYFPQQDLRTKNRVLSDNGRKTAFVDFIPRAAPGDGHLPQTHTAFPTREYGVVHVRLPDCRSADLSDSAARFAAGQIEMAAIWTFEEFGLRSACSSRGCRLN